MLQKMRVFAKSWVASVFLLVVVGSFTLWGIADMLKGRSDTSAFSAGSETVDASIYSREYRNTIRTESQRMGREITAEMARKLGVGQQVLDQMIDRTVLDNLAKDLGLAVSDTDVSARVHTMQMFYGPLGTFDRQAFESVLRQREYSEPEFVDLMRKDMTRTQLLQPQESGFSVPPGYAHAIFAFSTEQRAAQYVVLTAQALGAIAPPDDGVLQAYAKAHADRFSTPEYRTVSVAVIGPEDVAPGINLTDAQIKHEYEARSSVYIIPEKRDVQQIVFPDEASAKAARAKIDGGVAFEGAAFQAKQTIDDRGTVAKDDLGDLGAAVFALPEGGVTQPLKNISGWVLMHVSKITPGKTTTFEQAKPELTKVLTDQLAQAKMTEIGNVYLDAVGGGAEIAEAARKAGMRLVRVAAVDGHGLAPDGSKVALPADPELIAHIFDAEAGGEPSDPFSTTTGHTYAIAVEGVTPPKLKSFDAVRADILQSWTKEQTAKLMAKRAEELAAEARGDGSLDDVAHKLGAPVQSGPALSRDAGNDIFSQAVIDKLFSVPANAVVSGPLAKGDGYIIARVSGVYHPPLSPSDRAYRIGIRQLSGQIAGDITMSTAMEARDRQKVTINQKNVDQAVGGGEGS